MNVPRLAAWIVGLAVGTAWLASAAGVGRRAPVTRPVPRSPGEAQLTALATDVQAQASQLRERLSTAPAPARDGRNLFAFVAAPRVVPRTSTPTVEPPPTPVDVPISEPTLTLIGVAEMPGASGPVRTAMLTGPAGDLLMVTAGQTVIGRYHVTTISPDAVQLKDVASGALRTLVLR